MTASFKLTKGELRVQRKKLTEFQSYLPILSLKKSLLQRKVMSAQASSSHLKEEFDRLFHILSEQKISFSLNPKIGSFLVIESVLRSLENVAGVKLPYISSIIWDEPSYSISGTPIGTEQFILVGRRCLNEKIRFDYAQKRLQLLKEELKRVSIRTNLIEKVLIPRLKDNIKKILVFLGDVELAAIGRSKMAKKKKAQADNGLLSSS